MPDLTVDKLILFLFAVVPGFVAMQVYGLKVPTAQRDWSKSILEIISYSLINLTIWLLWVAHIITTSFTAINKVELFFAIIVICLASPCGLALFWYYLRTKILHRRLGLDHPTPRGWDHFVRNNHEFWALFHLKGGKLLGGYFGDKSYAATFPQDPEVYVEEVWRVNETGEFVEGVDCTLGAVIRLSECERVEFLAVRREPTNGQSDQQRPSAAESNGRTDGSHDTPGGPTGTPAPTSTTVPAAP